MVSDLLVLFDIADKKGTLPNIMAYIYHAPHDAEI
jgi:hypothetical protein